MPRPNNKEELIAAVRRGEAPELLFFYGHTPGPKLSCLSQWSDHPFIVEGVTYPTAEHWMMAWKARIFLDTETLAKILKAPHPKTAKALGREVKNYSEKAWQRARMSVVVQGNFHKFKDNHYIRDILLGTGDKILVEAALNDKIWGIGLNSRNLNASDPRKWPGENLLGFALMQVRDMLV